MTTKFSAVVLRPFLKDCYSFRNRVSTFRTRDIVCSNLCSQSALVNNDHSIEKKIIYNSLKNRMNFGHRKQEERLERKLLKEMSSIKETSVCLKYLIDVPNNKVSNNSPEQPGTNSEYIVQLPYKLKKPDKEVIVDADKEEFISLSESFVDERKIDDNICDLPTSTVRDWMNDYEKYTQPIMEDEGNDLDPWKHAYGTPDVKMAVSQVPCGGCGALLHCQDHSIPGYLPSEIFKNCNNKDLAKLVCQRCHFLKDFNTALSVSVDPEIYPKLLSKIRKEKALVLLLVDMTDLPSSVWPGILDIIGPQRPLFLIGNKIDLLWGDGKGWMDHALTCLRSCLPKNADVQFTTLISAKTGYGIEELITKLHNIWQYKGDVYLIGCTNVGKSTLFNSLLQSDYCKVKAVDLIQRATTAPWPGTTLNLLKFPILRPQAWRLYLRTMRLHEEQAKRQADMKLKNIKIRGSKSKEIPQIVGHIGRTFYSKRPLQEMNAKDNFSLGLGQDKLGLDPNDPDFAASKWVYDTPGVLHQEQILDLLTTEEVSLTIPKDVIKPRTFNMKEGWSLFVGGLARIDYVKGNKKIKVTVFSSKSLPITIVGQEDADEVYRQLLGTEYMSVPRGPGQRLNIWPGLEKAMDVSFCGIHGNRSCADVTLSSAGWVAITPEENEITKLSFWTPKGRGVHVRDPPLLPNAVKLRGKKILKVPAYGTSKYVHTNIRPSVSI